MLGIRILAQKGWSIQHIHRYTGYSIPSIVAILHGQTCSPPHPTLEMLAAPPASTVQSVGWGHRTSFDHVAAFVGKADTVQQSWNRRTMMVVDENALS